MVFWELSGELVGEAGLRKPAREDKCHKDFALAQGTTDSPLPQSTCPLGAPEALAQLRPCPWLAASCWGGLQPWGRKRLPTEFGTPCSFAP